MISVHQPDALGFRATLDDLVGTLEPEILDQSYRVAIRQDGAVGILDHPRARAGRCRFLPRPFMSAGLALPERSALQKVGRLTHWTFKFTHGEKR